MDAANVDLKAFTERFYHKITGSHLEPVLDTLKYIKHETDCWLETTTLIIPGENDSEKELTEMCEWVVENLGPDMPMHFSAFHPDFKMMDVPSTPPSTLTMARDIAMKAGVRYAYVGNVHNRDADSTWCHQCGELLIERDWYELGKWNLNAEGCCKSCGTKVAGVFESKPGNWGAKRLPVRMKQ
jgi:pyruvate formate lyase activating enzyme